jgi:hypothetical protein
LAEEEKSSNFLGLPDPLASGVDLTLEMEEFLIGGEGCLLQ